MCPPMKKQRSEKLNVGQGDDEIVQRRKQEMQKMKTPQPQDSCLVLGIRLHHVSNLSYDQLDYVTQ